MLLLSATLPIYQIYSPVVLMQMMAGINGDTTIAIGQRGIAACVGDGTLVRHSTLRSALSSIIQTVILPCE